MRRTATVHLTCLVGGLLMAAPGRVDARQTSSVRQSSPVVADAPHAGHGQQTPRPAAPAPEPEAADAHDHAESGQSALPPFIPRLTDADRKAAFPDVQGHAVHDNAVNYFVLFDQLEWQTAGGVSGLNWDNKTWVGGDLNRLWLRSEGETDHGGVEHAEAHALYGRAFARWWDVVAGVRQDVRPGPQQTWAAVGVQGLAPYWFEVEATAYVGEGGQTAARFEVEYELLLSNRLVLQPLVEINLYGTSSAEPGIGAGLSTTEAGFRLRYEFRRELAPYLGVTWTRRFGKTAGFAAAAGEDGKGARLVTGVRLWF